MKNSTHALVIILLTTSQSVFPAESDSNLTGYSGGTVISALVIGAAIGAVGMKLLQARQSKDPVENPKHEESINNPEQVAVHTFASPHHRPLSYEDPAVLAQEQAKVLKMIKQLRQ